MCMSGKNSGNFENYFFKHFNELKHLKIFQKKVVELISMLGPCK